MVIAKMVLVFFGGGDGRKAQIWGQLPHASRVCVPGPLALLSVSGRAACMQTESGSPIRFVAF